MSFYSTPRPAMPSAPFPTPSSTLAAMSRPRVGKAPIHNPYDKFTQPEFDEFIGDITGALRRALGHCDRQPLASSFSDATREDQFPEAETAESDDAPSDEYEVEDSFAELKARRSNTKDKGRHIGDGPGLLKGQGSFHEPIELIDSDDDSEGDEEQEEVDEGYGEDAMQEDSPEYEPALNEDQLEEEQDQGHLSSDDMIEVGSGSEDNGERQELFDDDEEQHEDEENELRDQFSELVNPNEEDNRDYDAASSRAEEVRELSVLPLDQLECGTRPPDHEAQHTFGRRADTDLHVSVHDAAVPSGSRYEPEAYLDSEHLPDVPVENGLQEEDCAQWEVDGEEEPLSNDDPIESEPSKQVLELPDPWQGPRTYAEDFYSGGDRIGGDSNPHHFGGEIQDMDMFLTPGVLTPAEPDSAEPQVLDEHEANEDDLLDAESTHPNECNEPTQGVEDLPVPYLEPTVQTEFERDDRPPIPIEILTDEEEEEEEAHVSFVKTMQTVEEKGVDPEQDEESVSHESDDEAESTGDFSEVDEEEMRSGFSVVEEYRENDTFLHVSPTEVIERESTIDATEEDEREDVLIDELASERMSPEVDAETPKPRAAADENLGRRSLEAEASPAFNAEPTTSLPYQEWVSPAELVAPLSPQGLTSPVLDGEPHAGPTLIEGVAQDDDIAELIAESIEQYHPPQVATESATVQKELVMEPADSTTQETSKQSGFQLDIEPPLVEIDVDANLITATQVETGDEGSIHQQPIFEVPAQQKTDMPAPSTEETAQPELPEATETFLSNSESNLHESTVPAAQLDGAVNPEVSTGTQVLSSTDSATSSSSKRSRLVPSYSTLVTAPTAVIRNPVLYTDPFPYSLSTPRPNAAPIVESPILSPDPFPYSLSTPRPNAALIAVITRKPNDPNFYAEAYPSSLLSREERVEVSHEDNIESEHSSAEEVSSEDKESPVDDYMDDDVLSNAQTVESAEISSHGDGMQSAQELNITKTSSEGERETIQETQDTEVLPAVGSVLQSVPALNMSEVEVVEASGTDSIVDGAVEELKTSKNDEAAPGEEAVFRSTAENNLIVGKGAESLNTSSQDPEYQEIFQSDVQAINGLDGQHHEPAAIDLSVNELDKSLECHQGNAKPSSFTDFFPTKDALGTSIDPSNHDTQSNDELGAIEGTQSDTPAQHLPAAETVPDITSEDIDIGAFLESVRPTEAVVPIITEPIVPDSDIKPSVAKHKESKTAEGEDINSDPHESVLADHPISPTQAAVTGSGTSTAPGPLPLPYDWEVQFNNNDQPYYVDHNTRTTSLGDPRRRAGLASSVHSLALQPEHVHQTESTWEVHAGEPESVKRGSSPAAPSQDVVRHSGVVDNPVNDPDMGEQKIDAFFQGVKPDASEPVSKLHGVVDDFAKHDHGMGEQEMEAFQGVEPDVSEPVSKVSDAVDDPVKHDTGMGEQEIDAFLQRVKPDISDPVSRLPGAVDPANQDPGMGEQEIDAFQGVKPDASDPVSKLPGAVDDPANHDLGTGGQEIDAFLQGVKPVSDPVSKLPGAVEDPANHDPGMGEQEINVFLQGVKPDVSEPVSKLLGAVAKHDLGMGEQEIDFFLQGVKPDVSEPVSKLAGAVDDPAQHDLGMGEQEIDFFLQEVKPGASEPIYRQPDAVDNVAENDPGMGEQEIDAFFQEVKPGASEPVYKQPGAVDNSAKHDPGMGEQEIDAFLQRVKPDASELVLKPPGAADDPAKHDPGIGEQEIDAFLQGFKPNASEPVSKQLGSVAAEPEVDSFLQNIKDEKSKPTRRKRRRNLVPAPMWSWDPNHEDPVSVKNRDRILSSQPANATEQLPNATDADVESFIQNVQPKPAQNVRGYRGVSPHGIPMKVNDAFKLMGSSSTVAPRAVDDAIGSQTLHESSTPRSLKRKRPTGRLSLPKFSRSVKPDKGKGKAEPKASESSSSSAEPAVRLLEISSQSNSRASSVTSTSPATQAGFLDNRPKPSAQPMLHVHSHPRDMHHHHRLNPSLPLPRPQPHQAPSVPAPDDSLPPISSADHNQFPRPGSPAGPSQVAQSLSNSPRAVTRSHCRYHRISLPLKEGGPRVFFLVPGCSLVDRELMREEDIKDEGEATIEDRKRMIADLDNLSFDSYLVGILRKLVGVDLLREQEVYYLPQPGQEDLVKAKARPDKSASIKLSSRTLGTDGMISPTGSIRSPYSSRAPVSFAGSASTVSQPRNDDVYSDAYDSEGSDYDSEVDTTKLPENVELQQSSSQTPSNRPSKRGRKRLRPDVAEYRPGENEGSDHTSDAEGSISRKPKRKRGLKRSRTMVEATDREEVSDSRQMKKARTADGLQMSLSNQSIS